MKITNYKLNWREIVKHGRRQNADEKKRGDSMLKTLSDIKRISIAIQTRLDILKKADPGKYSRYCEYLERARKVALIECWPELWRREDGSISIPDDLETDLIPETRQAVQIIRHIFNQEPYFEHLEKI